MSITSLLTENVADFIHAVTLGFIALFPVVNPIGTAFVINPFFEGVSQKERTGYVRRIAFMVFYFSTAIIFTGHWILELFGISVDVVRVAGGIVIFMLGWNMLSGKDDPSSKVDTGNDDNSPPARKHNVASMLLYPITFPMTAGAGAISVLLTLSSHSANKGTGGYILNMGATLLSVALICIVTFFIYANTNKIIERLGSKNKVVAEKIFAFLIMCVAIDIASTGLIQLFNL